MNYKFSWKIKEKSTKFIRKIFNLNWKHTKKMKVGTWRHKTWN
jgi:hypothetical protein